MSSTEPCSSEYHQTVEYIHKRTHIAHVSNEIEKKRIQFSSFCEFRLAERVTFELRIQIYRTFFCFVSGYNFLLLLLIRFENGERKKRFFPTQR